LSIAADSFILSVIGNYTFSDPHEYVAFLLILGGGGWSLFLVPVFFVRTTVEIDHIYGLSRTQFFLSTALMKEMKEIFEMK
jgi:hypothetical protein